MKIITTIILLCLVLTGCNTAYNPYTDSIGNKCDICVNNELVWNENVTDEEGNFILPIKGCETECRNGGKQMPDHWACRLEDEREACLNG